MPQTMILEGDGQWAIAEQIDGSWQLLKQSDEDDKIYTTVYSAPTGPGAYQDVIIELNRLDPDAMVVAGGATADTAARKDLDIMLGPDADPRGDADAATWLRLVVQAKAARDRIQHDIKRIEKSLDDNVHDVFERSHIDTANALRSRLLHIGADLQFRVRLRSPMSPIIAALDDLAEMVNTAHSDMADAEQVAETLAREADE